MLRSSGCKITMQTKMLAVAMLGHYVSVGQWDTVVPCLVQDKRCRPILFQLDDAGDQAGDQEPFPTPNGPGSNTGVQQRECFDSYV